MAATLTQQALNYGKDNYFDEGLLQVYQDHKRYFLNLPSTSANAINKGILYRNRYDPYGLLIDMSIDPLYAWVVLMLNDLINGEPLDQNLEFLYVPDFNEVERIRTAYEASKTIA